MFDENVQINFYKVEINEEQYILIFNQEVRTSQSINNMHKDKNENIAYSVCREK